MKAALFNGIVGLGLVLSLGIKYLGLTFGDSFFFVFISNTAALVALILTLQAERNPWILKHFLNRSLKTWAFLVLIYSGILFGFLPALQSWKAVSYLAFPLIMSCGFAIIVFGPIQDFLVRRQQRKVKELQHT